MLINHIKKTYIHTKNLLSIEQILFYFHIKETMDMNYDHVQRIGTGFY